jgi:alkylation response protein AidB-like acyl-CoA dehydrogenase
VVYDAVQLLGGYGCAREYLIEYLCRDSQVPSRGGGTTEIIGRLAQFRPPGQVREGYSS